MVVRCAKTAELIDKPFWLKTQVGRRNRVRSCLLCTDIESGVAELVWPMSNQIMASAVSPCSTLMATALANNDVVIWNRDLGKYSSSRRRSADFPVLTYVQGGTRKLRYWPAWARKKSAAVVMRFTLVAC